MTRRKLAKLTKDKTVLYALSEDKHTISFALYDCAPYGEGTTVYFNDKGFVYDISEAETYATGEINAMAELSIDRTAEFYRNNIEAFTSFYEAVTSLFELAVDEGIIKDSWLDTDKFKKGNKMTDKDNKIITAVKAVPDTTDKEMPEEGLQEVKAWQYEIKLNDRYTMKVYTEIDPKGNIYFVIRNIEEELGCSVYDTYRFVHLMETLYNRCFPSSSGDAVQNSHYRLSLNIGGPLGYEFSVESFYFSSDDPQLVITYKHWNKEYLLERLSTESGRVKLAKQIRKLLKTINTEALYDVL